jgi:FAD/FMN-containing dehydrogenase
VVAVRGGGHSAAGLSTCDGGLVIDLSGMKAVHVDATARLARADGGARWGDVDAATQAHALATPGGVVSDTGIAGLTLGGGYGHLRNRYGLSCDNLASAEVVTADGRVLRASETENADLFWGIRGGGGNFGIVTSFEYRLHPVGPEVALCMVFHDGSTREQMRDALRFYREYTTTAPDEVSLLAALGVIPPGHEAFPAEIHGKPFEDAMGPENQKKVADLMNGSVDSTTAVLFAFNPKMSYPPKEWMAADTYWAPKVERAAVAVEAQVDRRAEGIARAVGVCDVQPVARPFLL